MSENLMSNDYAKFAVPISRFEEGETEKIFEELEEIGLKAVFKNGLPCAILVSLEMFKDYILLFQHYKELFEGEDPKLKNAIREFNLIIKSQKKAANLEFSSRKPQPDKELH